MYVTVLFPDSTRNLVDRFGQPLDVARRYTRDRDTTVLCRIYRVLVTSSISHLNNKNIKKKTNLLGQSLHLLGLESSIGKHANLTFSIISYIILPFSLPVSATHLASNMGPVMLAAQFFQVLLQQRPHLDDPVSHALDFSQPLLFQRRIVQDLGCNPRTVNRRVRVERPHKDLQLRFHPFLLLVRRTHQREGTHTFTIKALYQFHSRQNNHNYFFPEVEQNPTIFLAKLWHRAILWPSLTKYRGAKASRSAFPLAKPW